MGAGNDGGTVTIINSTLADNVAFGGIVLQGTGSGGGSGLGGAVFNLDGSVSLFDDTLADNGAVDGTPGRVGAGGAVYNLAFGNNITNGLPVAAQITLANTILSNSISTRPNTDLGDLSSQAINGGGTNHAVVSATGPNLIQTIGDDTTVGGTAPITGVDPMLGSLSNNGGPTQTLALLPGSPALDAGSTAALPADVTTDQRGAGFARVSGSTVDLGAFEHQQTPSVPPAPAPSAPIALSASPPPGSVSVAFPPGGGEVLAVVTPTGALFLADGTGRHQLAGSGIASASVTFGPAGQVLDVVTTGGALFQVDATGLHQLTTSGIASASVAFGPAGQVLDVVTTGGALFQVDATGPHQLAGSGIASASVASGPTGQVLEVVTTSGALFQVDRTGLHQLAAGGITSASVTFSSGVEVLDVLLSDGTLFQSDATGLHNLGKLF
jgi:hypothetical protein